MTSCCAAARFDNRSQISEAFQQHPVKVISAVWFYVLQEKFTQPFSYPPLILQGACEIWPRFATSITFEALRFRNGAISEASVDKYCLNNDSKISPTPLLIL